METLSLRCTVFEISDFKNAVTLKTGLGGRQGHWMRCDRAHMTSYWRSVVTMALSCVVSEIFNVKNVVTLKSGSKVTHGHWEWYHSIDCLSSFFSNFVSKTHRFWDIRIQKCRDLENRVRGPSRSLEMSPFDTAHMTSYWRSTVTMALSRVVSKICNV